MRTKLSQFNYDLPEELIAKYPTKNRDESRMMVLHRDSGKIEHKLFKDLKDYFDEGDTMVFNNTKVIRARLFGRKEKTDARIEVFLLRELNNEVRLWDVLVDPARKIRVGNKLYFPNAEGEEVLVAEVLDNTTSRGRTIRFFFNGTNEELKSTIDELGSMPLPKYLKREVEELDEERYQTVYAKELGAVAAPTAGLHFSRSLMKHMEIKGTELAEITLHVGLGTFSSIDVEDLSKHKMDAEYYRIEQECVDKVNLSKASGKRVCGVGTTTMRALESSITATGELKTSVGWTNNFIFPPYDFSIANCMVTNFHLPKTSLLIMISAFADVDFIKAAYQEAIKEKYRFFTYGDAMLIL